MYKSDYTNNIFKLWTHTLTSYWNATAKCQRYDWATVFVLHKHWVVLVLVLHMIHHLKWNKSPTVDFSHYNLPNRQKVKSSHSIWVKQKCYVCKLIQYGFFCCSHITVGGVSKNEFFEFMKPRNFFWNDKLNTSCRCGTVQQTYSMLIACISIILLHILTRSKRLHSNACN